MNHLLDVTSLDTEIIHQLLQRAQYFLNESKKQRQASRFLSHEQIVANLFFEASTRSRNAFAIAAQRLSVIFLNPNMEQSSTLKGESFLDTVRSFEAMGVDLFVIRHGESGICRSLVAELSGEAAIINAGDGDNQHPTQCLIDLFTIKKHKPYFPDVKVTIVGDVRHSRVAHSLAEGLRIMGTTHISFVAPPAFAPLKQDQYGAGMPVYSSIEEGLSDADVVVALRVQRERMEQTTWPNPEAFRQQFGITAARLAYAKPDAIVMHAGPINRDVEIDSVVADGPQSVILDQVRWGVAVRMAVMDYLLSARLAK